jgi:hypothetical protein
MFMRVPFAMLAVAVVCSTHAQAADNIRYVSTTGANANACTLVAPCRTFQRGVNTTPTGGELRILDSGDYGVNANVNRSMTISANGHTVILGNAITINNAGAVVALRGLTLDGQGTVVDGINIANAAKVHVEQCVIHHFTGQGIVSGAAEVEVFVLDSVSRDNGASGFNLANSTELQRVTIDNSRFENNGSFGVLVQSGLATISRSIASGNAQEGIFSLNASVSMTVKSTTSAFNGGDGFRVTNGTMTVDSSVAHGNGGSGLIVIGSGVGRISNSTFTDNTIGVANGSIGATVETRGNNTARGNSTNNTSGTLTPIGGI